MVRYLLSLSRYSLYYVLSNACLARMTPNQKYNNSILFATLLFNQSLQISLKCIPADSGGPNEAAKTETVQRAF